MPLIKLSICCQVQFKDRYPELFHFSVSHAVGVRNTAVYLPCVAAFRNVSMSVTYLPNIHKAVCIARSKRDGTRAETRFGLSAKRTSPFKSAGVSIQSTSGSWGARISGQQLYRPCSDVQCKAAGYPLHSHLSLHFPAMRHRVPSCSERAIIHLHFTQISYQMKPTVTERILRHEKYYDTGEVLLH